MISQFSVLFFFRNIKYTEYFYSVEQLDETPLWVFVKQRQKGVEACGGEAGCAIKCTE